MVCIKRLSALVIICLLMLQLSGCTWLNSPAKPEPQVKPGNSEPELTYLEKVKRPPTSFFDLVSQIDNLFKPLNKMDFVQAQEEYQKMLTTWESAKAEAGNIKGIKETDEAIVALGTFIATGKASESMAGLNKFTNHLQELLTNYKLSPLSDIINLSTISHNVSWELENHDYKKAFVRTEELKKTWEQSKTNLEIVGILGEVTKGHEAIAKIKGAVTAENKMSADDQLKKFNENLEKIRDFYRQRNNSILP